MTRRSVRRWSAGAEFQEVGRLGTEVKPKSNRILLIFGVFLAIVAFGGALLVGRTSGGNVSVGGGSKNVPAVVAKQDIPASTQITAAMVDIQQFSADQAPPYAFRAKDLVVGKFAAIPIHTGSAINDYHGVTDPRPLPPATPAPLPP